MDINPQEVIKQLSSEIARLNVEIAILKVALEQTQVANGIQEKVGEEPH